MTRSDSASSTTSSTSSDAMAFNSRFISMQSPSEVVVARSVKESPTGNNLHWQFSDGNRIAVATSLRSMCRPSNTRPTRICLPFSGRQIVIWSGAALSSGGLGSYCSCRLNRTQSLPDRPASMAINRRISTYNHTRVTIRPYAPYHSQYLGAPLFAASSM